MSKIKRFVAAGVIFVLFITSLTNVSAAHGTYDEDNAKNILTDLGIYNSASTITKKDFVISLMGFVYEKSQIADEAENYAKQYNMIGKNENFDGSSEISMVDAARYAVALLGYNVQAELNGGYPYGYIKTASDLKLTSGMEVSEKKKLKETDYIKLLYRMLDAEPMGIALTDSSINKIRVEKGETLLSAFRDIYEVTGIQTADGNTSLNSANGLREGKVAIDDTEYVLGDNISETYLGRNVVAYYREVSGDDPIILSLSENKSKNKTLIMRR